MVGRQDDLFHFGARHPSLQVLLLMAEILHHCTDEDYPIIYTVLYIPGGCLGFLNHQQYVCLLNFQEVIYCCFLMLWLLLTEVLSLGIFNQLSVDTQWDGTAGPRDISGVGRDFWCHTAPRVRPKNVVVWVDVFAIKIQAFSGSRRLFSGGVMIGEKRYASTSTATSCCVEECLM